MITEIRRNAMLILALAAVVVVYEKFVRGKVAK